MRAGASLESLLELDAPDNFLMDEPLAPPSLFKERGRAYLSLDSIRAIFLVSFLFLQGSHYVGSHHMFFGITEQQDTLAYYLTATLPTNTIV